MRLFNDTGMPVGEFEFCANMYLCHSDEIFCRSPKVEIVYTRESPLKDTSVLGIHVVWMQFTDDLYEIPDDGHWDLYYKYFYVPSIPSDPEFPNSSGIGVMNWNAIVGQPAQKIEAASTELNEMGHDISVIPDTGDVLVVYHQCEGYEQGFTPSTALAVHGVYEDEHEGVSWHDPYVIFEETETPKMSFAVDVNWMNSTPDPEDELELRAACAWGQLVENDPHDIYEVMYSAWDPYEPGTLTTGPIQLTESQYGSGLPSVDIPSIVC